MSSVWKYLLAFVLITLINVPNPAVAQQAFRMKLQAQFNDPNLPKVDGTDIWNDIYGYYDPVKQREYIICGGTDSIYFMDITEPGTIKMIARVHGASIFCRNRDYETYSHYAYCVSDQGSGIGALQIFDLQYLPDSVHKVYQSNALCTFAHTLHIDTASARMYLCSVTRPGGFSALDVLSLENPEVPRRLFKLEVPQKPGGIPIFNKVHEMFAKHDTAYLSCEEAGLFIFDLRDTLSHKLIGSINSYPDQGYNHSSWLDKSGRYLMFTDENMGLDIKIFDIASISSPLFVSQFNSNTSAMPHNAYWYGDFAYASSYHDGVRIYNVKDPGNPYAVAWYDTHPETPEVYGGYKGCWGVYPWLPSKRIIASDLTSGIFVLELDSGLTGTTEALPETNHFNIYPNPAKDQLQMSADEPGTWSITNLQGRVMWQSTEDAKHVAVDVSAYPAGVYLTTYQNKNNISTRKWIRQ